jgi:hypothetical protein
MSSTNQIKLLSMIGACAALATLAGCGQAQDKVETVACSQDSDCADGEKCNTISGKCRAKTTSTDTASSCSSSADCTSLDKPVCNATTGKCEAKSTASAGSCSPACETDTVCLENGPNGVAQCVPDCRVEGQTCPSQVPTCDESTGLCGGGNSGGGGGTPSTSTDCRENAQACLPGQDCDPTSGACTGDAFKSCSESGACDAGFVCIVGPNLCAPDCTAEGGSCPNGMTCDEATGMCAGGNTFAACSASGTCDTGFVCVTGPNVCAPDCRISGNACPTEHPTCSQSTGMCS